MTDAGTTPWWRPRSLRRQLVFGISAVVTVVWAVVGAVSVPTLRSYVMTIIDVDVSESMNALNHSYARFRAGDGTPGSGPGIERAVLDFTGQTPGNVIAVLHDGHVIGTALFFSEDVPHPAPADVVATLESTRWVDGPPRSMDLGELGSYRLDTRGLDDGDRLVVGVSQDVLDRIVANRALTSTALLLAALAVTAVLTISVVNYALRPLRRVAATAGAVANMPLTDGDDRITARVSPHAIDPANEVGIVAHTLNRLLDNVDSALAYRTEADRRMRQFLSDASHELRTPLAAIQGYAELTRQDSSALPPTTEYALARIESEARRMASLVEELLLLSRLGEGQDLDIDDVDLGDLVSHAVNDTAASTPGHHWLADLPDEPVWVRGDRARLHQLVTNLLKNAAVHTPAGTTVTTAITADGAVVELTVTDDGPGIDAELLPHLFERFVRAQTARPDAPGTGLGLAIVASIVQAHRGTVSADSAGGRTVFRVRLPLMSGIEA